MSIHPSNIRLAQSTTKDTVLAVTEFHTAVVQPDMAFVLFFCSSEYDLKAMAEEMNRLFVGVQVVGCTTAGEIGPAGYLQHSLSGVSFPASDFTVVNGLLEGMATFKISEGHGAVQELLQRLEREAPQANADDCFALMLIDGMSKREEVVAHALQLALGKIRLVGGSAGDEQKFAKSYIFCDGEFHDNSAVLVLFNTTLPFTLFKTQHFVSTNERMVVTGADTGQRIIKEINGLPAAEEYARLLGIGLDELNSTSFAASPVVVLIDGTDYVRSIQKVNPDGSMTFFCAIEEGVVFRVAHGVSLLENLQQTFHKIKDQIGTPQLVIGCDCFLRKLEATQNDLNESLGEVLRHNNTIGFNSYGEQFHGVHVNQTFTGVAIGEASAANRVASDNG